MTSFVEAVANQSARTTNGMLARKSTANACVDLFFAAGASRGKNIIPQFTAAYVEDAELALRIAQWLRDARGGAGERELFRQILVHLEQVNPTDAKRLLGKIPEIGRYDDLLVFKSQPMKASAFTLLGDALRAGNGLAAKWVPRKGNTAREIREFFGMTPKQYRKSLVALTNVVETQMCAKDFDGINFSHVPSVAHARYKKAFNRNTTKYAEYVAKLAAGDKTVKINAGAVYPYDVLKGAMNSYQVRSLSKTEKDAIDAQWAALPNFIGDADVLPMVDSSGSMTCPAGGHNSKSSLSCLEVALSLGLYFADKNTGKFKDTFLTFSRNPKLVTLKGSITDKVTQMNTGEVANTDLNKAFDLILKTAVDNQVPQAEMPGTLVIFSDMQFDQGCDGYDQTAIKMIERKYAEAGYTVPRVVFWNLNAAYGNTPVKFDKRGTALVSGFSPALAESVMSNDLEDFTPLNVMLKAVCKTRYDL
jgi:Domain of unknown function (DUF2828)